jgi:hypothetical protein
MWRSAAFLFLSFLTFAASAACAAVPTEEKPVAVLRALDKVTGRVEEIYVRTEVPYKCGTLVVLVHSCRVTPPEETPESAVFLDVGEIKVGEKEKNVFRGWMFSSSPALSAMEHPVYDLWLVGCQDPDAAEQGQ